MQTQNEHGLTPHVQAIVSTPFAIGDRVHVSCNDEGFAGQVGEITHVFPSGRCMVALGRITILNLPPEAMTREVLN